MGFPNRVTTDGTGIWLAVWESVDDLGATIGTDSDILVARSTNAGATWSAPSVLTCTERARALSLPVASTAVTV